MKNLIVANFRKKDKAAGLNSRSVSELLALIKAQLFNSKSFNWKCEDLLIVSNHKKCFDEGTWIEADLNETALTASKLFAVKYVYENNITDEPIWAHDLDAWQSNEFIEPKFLDAGFCHYSYNAINGGSQFWKKSGLDIVNYAIDLLKNKKIQKEEPCLQELYPLFKNRITILNSTYNVGCSGFVARYERAEKPIQVCHLHPTNRLAWQSHALDRNGIGYISVSKKLESNLRKFYTLQTELDKEGIEAQKNKIQKRLLKQQKNQAKV